MKLGLPADVTTILHLADLHYVVHAAAFTNTTSGSEFVSRNGRWLSDPAVVLRAKGASALLHLANPVYNAAAKTVTFKVQFERRALWYVLCHGGGQHLPSVAFSTCSTCE